MDRVYLQGETKMPYGLENNDQTKQARALKVRVKRLIQQELEDGMDPW